jgi:hypothetical protein
VTSIQTSPRARPRPGIPPGTALALAALVAGALLVVFGIPLLMQGPEFVERVTIRNPTAVPVEVSVGSTGTDDHLTLGSSAPRSRTTFETIVDPGSRWRLRFVANGGAIAQAEVPRDELERASWSYTIPEPVQDELSSRGGLAAPAGAARD